MVPKKKRCRKTIRDSGLGISQTQVHEKSVEKEVCMPENDTQQTEHEHSTEAFANFTSCSLVKTCVAPENKSIAAEKANVTPQEERGSSENTRCSPEKRSSSEKRNVFLEKTINSPEDSSGASEQRSRLPEYAGFPNSARNCTNRRWESSKVAGCTTKRAGSSRERTCSSPEKACSSPERACSSPERASSSPERARALSKRIKPSPDRPSHFLERARSSSKDANDPPEESSKSLKENDKSSKKGTSEKNSDETATGSSEKARRNSLQELNCIEEIPNSAEKLLMLPVGTTSEKQDSNNYLSEASAETEIFCCKPPKKSDNDTQKSYDNESLHLDELCPSQNTGRNGERGCNEQNGKGMEPNDGKVIHTEHVLPMNSFSCPVDGCTPREMVFFRNEKLLGTIFTRARQNLASGSRNNFQFQTRIFPGIDRTQRHGFHVIGEPQNREGQAVIEDRLTQQSGQSLSVWSETRSEYFPSGKPSDLGELLDVAARYVVKAWVKDMKPSISGPAVNLVIKFCRECHRRYPYNENDIHHLCLKRREPGLQIPLKLMFYTELEIYDETHETLKVSVLGDQAEKLFRCQPHEFISNYALQKRIWNAFKQLIKGGNTKNWCLKDAADFSLEPHLKGKTMQYRLVDVRPFGCNS